MSTIVYFVRSHRGEGVAAVILGSGGFGWFWAGEVGARIEQLPLVLVFGPLACGCVIAASSYEPFGEIERTASGDLWRYRLWLVGLGLVAAVAVLWLGVHGTGRVGLVVLARNLLGFTGLASLAALWLGPRLAWLPALLFAMAFYLSDSARTPDRLPHTLWAGPLARYDNLTALGLGCCFGVGIALVVVRGPRASAWDQE